MVGGEKKMKLVLMIVTSDALMRCGHHHLLLGRESKQRPPCYNGVGQIVAHAERREKDKKKWLLLGKALRGFSPRRLIWATWASHSHHISPPRSHLNIHRSLCR